MLGRYVSVINSAVYQYDFDLHPEQAKSYICSQSAKKISLETIHHGAKEEENNRYSLIKPSWSGQTDEGKS